MHLSDLNMEAFFYFDSHVSDFLYVLQNGPEIGDDAI